MVKIDMPMAQWDIVLYILEDYAKRDWPRDPNPVVMAIHKEIEDQVMGREY